MTTTTTNLEEQEQWVKIQHKTFTNWCNFCFLSAGVDIRLTNLIQDLENGVNLIRLVEVLTGESLAPYNEKPRMRIHKAVNINIALKKIKDCGVVVTQGAEDIIDGNLKLILGLIWMLINRFQINTDPGGQKMSAKEAILNWVREYLKGYPIDLRDFPRCFQDGNIFNYLVHRGHPQLVDISNLDKRDKLEKLETAFTAAEKFGVPKLLAAEDVAVHPDEQSVLTYLSVFRAKVEAEGNMPPAHLEAKVKDGLDDLKKLQEEFDKWKQEAMEKIKKLQEESLDKNKQLETQQRRIAELEAQEKARAAAEDELAKLRAQLELLKKKLEEAEEARKKALNELDEANARIELLNKKLAKLEEELKRERDMKGKGSEETEFWKKKYEKVKAKHKAEKAKIAELEKRIKELEEEVGRLRKELESERARNKELMDEIAKLRAELATRDKDMKALQDEVAKLRAETRTKDDEIARLKQELEARTATQAELDAQRAKLFAELDQVRRERTRLQTENEELRRVHLQETKELQEKLKTLEEKQVSAARSDQQAENEALKKQIKTLNDMLEKQREMVRPIELLVRELYYRKGRRTVFEVLEEQYREDKALEQACIQNKEQVKRYLEKEKRQFHQHDFAGKKSESDFDKIISEGRTDKHLLKEQRNTWAQVYNDLGDLYKPKSTIEEKLEDWRVRLVELADDPAKLAAAQSELPKLLDEVNADLREDQELKVKIDNQMARRSSEKVRVFDLFEKVSRNMENRYLSEIERLEAIIKGGRSVDKSAVNVIEKMIQHYLLIFSKFEDDPRNSEVHQLVLKPIGWLDEHGLDTPDLMAKEDYKVAAVNQIKSYSYKGYTIDLSKVKDPFVIAQVLKGYFRDLVEPLLTYELYDEFTAAGAQDDANTPRRIRSLVNKLPPLRRATLTVLMNFLNRLSLRAKQNHMDARALAHIWAPILLRPPVAAKDTAPAAAH